MRLTYATGARVRSRHLVAGTLACLSLSDTLGRAVNQHRLRVLRSLYRVTDIGLPRKTLLWIRGRSAQIPSTTARE